MDFFLNTKVLKKSAKDFLVTGSTSLLLDSQSIEVNVYFLPPCGAWGPPHAIRLDGTHLYLVSKLSSIPG